MRRLLAERRHRLRANADRRALIECRLCPRFGLVEDLLVVGDQRAFASVGIRVAVALVLR